MTVKENLAIRWQGLMLLLFPRSAMDGLTSALRERLEEKRMGAPR